MCSSITQHTGCQPAWIIDIYGVAIPLTNPREASQSIDNTGAAICTTSSLYRYREPPLATHFGGQTSRSLTLCFAALFSSSEGFPSCIYSSDPCLKMWTPARGWMSFPSTTHLLLELVGRQNSFLQLTGIGTKRLKFSFACCLLNFNRKHQLMVGYSISYCSCTCKNPFSTGSSRSTKSYQALRPHLQGA